MNCRQFKNHLDAGGSPETPEAREHLEECAACRELAEDEAWLADVLGSVGSSTSHEEMDFEALNRRIDAEQGAFAELRELGSTVRTVLVTVVAAAVALTVFVQMRRPDMGVYPTLRFWTLAAGLFASSTGLFAVGLRPLYRPDPSASRSWIVLAITLGFSLVVGALPMAHRAHPVSLGGTGPELISAAALCFGVGVVLALPVCAVAWAARRTDRPFLFRSMFLAAGAGMVGNLGLHFHCPIVHPEHLLLGHATVPLLLTLATGGLVYATSGASRENRHQEM